MFDCVPSAELKITTKVFNINPRSCCQNHLDCLVLLLPAEAALEEEGAPSSSSHGMSAAEHRSEPCRA